MNTKFQKLKDQLQSLEKEDKFVGSSAYKHRNTLLELGSSTPTWLKMTLFGAFLLSFILYMGSQIFNVNAVDINTVESVQSWVDQPDEELLAGMSSWMEEMGYGNLSQQDLVELRQQGVMATFVSRIRDLGHENLTLDEAVRLQQNDVSATFATMMQELGYSLTVNDLIELRQHNVTAYYTSNLHDLGYTDITTEELIRLKDTGVEIAEVKQLMSDNSTKPTVSELIRHHISNQ
ncbi:hypothetical protein [Fodinibius salsisoli]|uniref:Uncharacterized protein n=1 Tax=Fodinibius salsisoli TaxID=2820877 RepID=A0ABT3PIZ8_9BACT|nr:hypothetical protein [Fodinibius salsisoli]MCW9705915.1 hypothetical protein [Fodinibius salsisoli]